MLRFPTQKKARIQLALIAGCLVLFVVGVKFVADYVDRIPKYLDLRNAIMRGDLAEVKRFESEGIDWRDLARLDYDFTALHLAIRNGQLELVRYFIDNGADTTANSPELGSAIDSAVSSQHLDIVKFLLIETEAADSFTDIPQSLYNIGPFADLELIGWLTERYDLAGVLATHDVYRLIYSAVQENDSATVEYLLSIGAPPGMKAGSWDEGFYRAPEPNSKDLGKWLSLYNTNDSLLPLHLAALRGNEAIVKLLIDYGANPDLPDLHGKRPIDYARENGHDQIEMLLSAPTIRDEL